MAKKDNIKTYVKGWSRRMAVMAGAIFIGGAGVGQAPELTRGEVGKVSSVLDGDTLYLEGGLKVRLSAMQAPKLPLGRKGFKAWPVGKESGASLGVLTEGQKVGLYYGGERRDRYDRALAQVFTLELSLIHISEPTRPY